MLPFIFEVVALTKMELNPPIRWFSNEVEVTTGSSIVCNGDMTSVEFVDLK
jgi:hypothetical protein